MAPPNQQITPPFGKKNWVVSELKEILNIQLLHLRCHAPVQPPTRHSNGKECDNGISIWYCLKVRGIILHLSKVPTDTAEFTTLLRQLARILCCKSLHGDFDRWESEIFENWKGGLYSAGERERRYLEERMALQDALRIRRPSYRVAIERHNVGQETEVEGAPAPMRPLPQPRSVMTLSRNPRLQRHGPRPIIHCIRHAEAGNGEENDWYNRDPELTKKGMEECVTLSRVFDRHDFVTHLVVSPLSRCISTAIHAFAPTIQRGINITLVPEIQAAGSCWSCIGLPPAELKKKYSIEKYRDIFDFEWVTDSWTNKLEGTYACNQQSVYKRAKDIFKWCRDGNDKDDGEGGRREIVLVTHASILSHFGHCWEVPSASWTTFTFDEDWKIYEIPSSKMRRHAPHPEFLEPYSPSDSASSNETIRPSRIPTAKFSTVKFRPNMVRDVSSDLTYSGPSQRQRSRIFDDWRQAAESNDEEN